MDQILIVITLLLMVCIWSIVLNIKKQRTMAEEIESLKIEMAKNSFRLFVIEKKQKNYKQQKTG